MNLHDASLVEMGFGRHKGQPLGTVPPDYLAWALREGKVSGRLREAIIVVLNRHPQPDAPPPVEVSRDDVLRASLAGIRGCAVDAIRALTAFVERLDQAQAKGPLAAARED